jgi:hypothetical protein
MARKKGKTAKRRRRVSGIGGFDFMAPAMVMVGAAAGTYIINGPMKTTSWVNYAAIGLGAALPMFVKSPMAKNFGLGLVAAGGVSALQNAGVISGTGVYVGSAGGAGPIPSLGSMTASQRGAQAIRNRAAGNSRVILNGIPSDGNSPISSIAGATRNWQAAGGAQCMQN